MRQIIVFIVILGLSPMYQLDPHNQIILNLAKFDPIHRLMPEEDHWKFHEDHRIHQNYSIF